MSGGSWNYLYSRMEDFESLHTDELTRMATRARELVPEGCVGVEAFGRLVQTVDEARALSASLAPAARDIEWADSHDSTEERARETLRAWPMRHGLPNTTSWNFYEAMLYVYRDGLTLSLRIGAGWGRPT